MTGASGFVKSYGWDGGEQISGQTFTFCIRREKGYCAIGYKPVIGVPSTSDAFGVDDNAAVLNVGLKDCNVFTLLLLIKRGFLHLY